jgi:hypothetical protein
MAKCDDLLTSGVTLRGEDGGFVGFRAAARKEAFFEFARSDYREFGSELGLQSCRIERRSMGNLLDLIDDGIDNLLIAMPDACGELSTESIQVFVTILIPDPHPLAVRKGDRLGIVVGHTLP